MAQSLDALVKQGEGDQDAVDLGDGIFMSREHRQQLPGHHARRRRDDQHRHRLRGARHQGPLRARSATARCGWSRSPRAIPTTSAAGIWFNEPGVETIAQANHADVREYWRNLHPFYVRRIMKLWGAFMDVEATAADMPPEPVLTASFIDSHAFEVGGRRFELYSTPGGETTDALVVWMPEHRTVFIGNLMGPFFGHVPNLYTLRGDKIRSAMAFIHSVDRVIALQPGDLINGHDVFRGADEIAATHDQGPRRDGVPPRPHHRRNERGQRPVDADAGRDAATPSSRCPRYTARCRGSCGRSGRSTSAGSATSRPPSSTTSRRRRCGRTSSNSPAAPPPLTDRARGTRRGRPPACRRCT